MKKKSKNPSMNFISHEFTGKHLADCMEASIGAYLMSGGVYHAMKFID
jgi:dsRNA-specific ribonuclease